MRLTKFLGISIWLSGLLLLSGCPGGGPDRLGDPNKSTVVLTAQIQGDAAAVHKILVEGNDSILAMLPKIPKGLVSVDAVQGRVKEADSHVQEITKNAGTAATSAKTDAKVIDNQARKIADLEASDPQVAWLNRIGIGLLVLGITLVGLGIWTGRQVLYIGGFVGAGVALGILTIAYFLHALQWVIVGLTAAAVVGAVVWFILNRKVAKDIAKDAANWIPVPSSSPGSVTTPTLVPPQPPGESSPPAVAGDRESPSATVSTVTPSGIAGTL